MSTLVLRLRFINSSEFDPIYCILECSNYFQREILVLDDTTAKEKEGLLDMAPIDNGISNGNKFISRWKTSVLQLVYRNLNFFDVAESIYDLLILIESVLENL